MTKETLDNLEKDCKTVLTRPDHNRDLLNMILSEDVPELINFARRVSNALETMPKSAAGMYVEGYYMAIMDLRKAIYESKG
jgi:hypothetical protein